MSTAAATKCSKPAGEPCRLHNPQGTGTVGISRESFINAGVRELATARKEQVLAEMVPAVEERKDLGMMGRSAQDKLVLAVFDARENMNLKTDPKTGKQTVSVYRSGVPQAPKKRGVEGLSYANADEHAPEGHQDRTTAVFASPTLYGVTRWVAGNEGIIEDLNVRELRVDPDEVRVYSVNAWQRASANYFDGVPEETHAKNYWATGMTLREYYKRMHTDTKFNPTEWELLINESQLQGVKNVVNKKVVEAAEAEHEWMPERVANALKKARKHLSKKAAA
jgi:hypothetical protein